MQRQVTERRYTSEDPKASRPEPPFVVGSLVSGRETKPYPMRSRLTIPIAIVFLAVVPIGADTIPRTPSGHPDLSGTYDTKTLTPLERPERFGVRLTLSEEEALEISRRAHETLARRNAASDPDRGAPPKGGDGSSGSAGNVGGYNAFWLDRGSGAFQINGKWRSSIITKPGDGRRPALRLAAQVRADARARFIHPNTGTAWWLDEELDPGPYDDPEIRPLDERCLLGSGSTGGPPMLPFAYNNLKRIIQTEDYVMILVEMIHDVRIIRMNAKHAAPDIRSWLGDSIGHWEGDTLVVDTTNFNDSPALEHASRDLHVVERIRRIDADTLLYQFTVEDPTVWTEPWGGEYVWPTTESRVYEYACHEANYSFGGILRGARTLENEALAGPEQ